MGLALVALAPVVVLAGTGRPVLHDGGDVQGVVDSTLSAAVEPVPVVVPGGHVDGCGTGVAGKVCLGWDPADVAGLGEDLRRFDQPPPR